ncbi:MAG: CRISPR-associated endonuclease Cas2 [Clostridia bacterium]|nr:CRISPR-associated endonuclease Cas2 [Clostridia bacterium]
MLVLIAYDINTTTAEGRFRLRTVSKLCERYGKRVQKSLFECSINAAEERLLEKELVRQIDPARDSLRIYLLGNHGFDKIVCLGNASPSFTDVLIY